MYKIPKDEVLRDAIADCMAKNPRIRTQRQLLAAVNEELSAYSVGYRAGPARIRRVGLKNRLFTLKIRYARSDRPPVRCPVCSDRLQPMMNSTIDSGEVELGRRCTRCGYSVKGDMARPAMYTITRRN